MLKDINRRLHGKLLLAALACLSSCRSSTPPKIEVCILDGFGGGDCVETDGTQKYRAPSDMKNYWATNENDEANFAAWCYQTSPANIAKGMATQKEAILGVAQ